MSRALSFATCKNWETASTILMQADVKRQTSRSGCGEMPNLPTDPVPRLLSKYRDSPLSCLGVHIFNFTPLCFQLFFSDFCSLIRSTLRQLNNSNLMLIGNFLYLKKIKISILRIFMLPTPYIRFTFRYITYCVSRGQTAKRGKRLLAALRDILPNLHGGWPPSIHLAFGIMAENLAQNSQLL